VASASGECARREAISSRITGNTEVDSHKIASGWPTILELAGFNDAYIELHLLRRQNVSFSANWIDRPADLVERVEPAVGAA
jgi:hypothetical protein